MARFHSFLDSSMKSKKQKMALMWWLACSPKVSLANNSSEIVIIRNDLHSFDYSTNTMLIEQT